VGARVSRGRQADNLLLNSLLAERWLSPSTEQGSSVQHDFKHAELDTPVYDGVEQGVFEIQLKS
jgi:hypothetical protein